jgi:hypothetical protein
VKLSRTTFFLSSFFARFEISVITGFATVAGALLAPAAAFFATGFLVAGFAAEGFRITGFRAAGFLATTLAPDAAVFLVVMMFP